MTYEGIIASVSVLIQLVGVIFYIRSMAQGKAKPNRVSWIIWVLAPLIGTWLAWQAGAGLSILPVFMAGFNPVLVLIASFIIKNGYWKITKFDIYCGIIALLALVMWVITKNFSISILFAITSDGLASLPTLIKSWKFPATENGAVYVGGILANVFGLSIIKSWTFPIYSMGVYFILMNLMIVFSLYRNKLYVGRKYTR